MDRGAEDRLVDEHRDLVRAVGHLHLEVLHGVALQAVLGGNDLFLPFLLLGRHHAPGPEQEPQNRDQPNQKRARLTRASTAKKTKAFAR